MQRNARVRHDGHAVVSKEVEIGLRSIAVALKNVLGKVVAALNNSLAAAQIEPRDLVSQFLEPLLRRQAGLMRVLA